MSIHSEPLQGSLFGESPDDSQQKNPPSTKSQQSNTDLSDQELVADAKNRPRKHPNLIKKNQRKHFANTEEASKQNEVSNPPWSHHSLIDLALLTPMLRHYVELKQASPERILLYRLGDFYECFFEDAIRLSQLLELTLTGKEGGKAIGRVPMAGIPHHAAERYCSEIIKHGLSVAICDQLESNPQKGSLLKREITRVLTPGTVLEEGMLQARRNNWLAAVIVESAQGNHPSSWGLACADISTGEFLVTQREDNFLLFQELSKLDASEIVWGGSETIETQNWCPERFHITKISNTAFSQPEAESALKKHYKLKTLNVLGLHDSPLALRAAGGLLSYLHKTRPSNFPSQVVNNPLEIVLDLPRSTFSGDSLILDFQTRRNLELTTTQRDNQFQGSLLWAIDRTLTAMGGRCLRRWVEEPLMDRKEILARQSVISSLVELRPLRQSIRRLLRAMGDLERLAGRAGAGQAGARELVAIADGLDRLPHLAAKLKILNSNMPTWFKALVDIDPDLLELANQIHQQLIDSPPLTISEGGLINDGVDLILDGLRNQLDDQDNWLRSQELIERKASGNQNLKIQHHRTFGYFIAVSKAKLNTVPEYWIRRQTLSNEERFITPLLKEREAKIFHARSRAALREYELFCNLREVVGKKAEIIRESARAVAGLDALSGLAEVAATNAYCPPSIMENNSKKCSRKLSIKGCRHPVVEQTIVEEKFQPNNIELGEVTDLIILTGPNASGKSCYLRQIGLVQLLAQIGSWVPAEEAHLSITDRIFTRVGAVDDLAAGQSTFMVEMAETAFILHHSTNRSLVLLDEIGRGTATFDGLSIAWAVSEFLALQIRSRTIFATHYHELNSLSEKLENVANFQVLVEETGNELLFLHKVAPGGASRSYGIEAARLAGIPDHVILRAKKILTKLEQSKQSTPQNNQSKAIKKESIQKAA